MGIVLNDYDSQSFVFSQDDIIEITWNKDEMKLSFGRRNGIEKYEIFPTVSEEKAKKLQFFTSLLVPGDKVEIVE